MRRFALIIGIAALGAALAWPRSKPEPEPEAPRAEPVGPIAYEYECQWIDDRLGYETVIIYVARDGSEIGRSRAAGDCDPSATPAE